MSNLPDLVEEIAAGFRKDAALLLNMACSYPGDPCGNMSTHAFILNRIADTIEDLDWELDIAAFRERNKVTITYDEEENT